jgi:tol-pal system protein YbgF
VRSAAGGPGWPEFFIAGGCGLLLTVCASAAGSSQLQADLDTLQQQVWKLQKDQAALTQQVTHAATAPAAPDNATAELRARLDSLERDIQVLQTRADESEQRLGALQGEVRATREAVEMLARAPAAAAPATPAAAAATPTPGEAPQPPAAAPVPGTAIGVDLYRLGYGDFSKGNFDLALAELQDFVRLNPSDDLADDAQYLIGEIYFSQQKYPEAVAAYDRLLAEHAGGDKAAAAYLKKGLALLETNRTADAVIQLQHVVSAYPKSEEARIARERLQALGLRER